jgi:UDP-N-acetylglucosamine:LPS N-acetylglucosamine transferase
VQKDLTGERLADRILALAADRTTRLAMSAAARRQAQPDAARLIVDAALKLTGRRPA